MLFSFNSCMPNVNLLVIKIYVYVKCLLEYVFVYIGH